MHVLGHDDVAEDLEPVAFPGEFEGVEEGVSCGGGVEIGEAVVTGEGEEVVVAFLLVGLQFERHGFDFIVLGFKLGMGWVREGSGFSLAAKMAHLSSPPQRSWRGPRASRDDAVPKMEYSVCGRVRSGTPGLHSLNLLD